MILLIIICFIHTTFGFTFDPSDFGRVGDSNFRCNINPDSHYTPYLRLDNEHCGKFSFIGSRTIICCKHRSYGYMPVYENGPVVMNDGDLVDEFTKPVLFKDEACPYLGPTASPTSSPTITTGGPTPSPTNFPTFSPTISTQQPTGAPTTATPTLYKVIYLESEDTYENLSWAIGGIGFGIILVFVCYCSFTILKKPDGVGNFGEFSSSDKFDTFDYSEYM